MRITSNLGSTFAVLAAVANKKKPEVSNREKPQVANREQPDYGSKLQEILSSLLPGIESGNEYYVGSTHDVDFAMQNSGPILENKKNDNLEAEVSNTGKPKVANWEEPEDSFKLQEIISVSIKDPVEAFLSGIESGNEYYVAFTHDKDYAIQNSLILEKKNDNLEADVALHIQVDKKIPLKCDVYQKVKYFADRKVGTVEFSPEELQTGQKRTQVKHKIMDKDGEPTQSELELDLIMQQWKDVYGDLKNPEEGKMEPFFVVAAAVLGVAVKNTRNPAADQLQRPTKAANPNLKMDALLGGILEFPVTDEFDSLPTKVKMVMQLMNSLPSPDTQTQYRNRADGIYQLRQVFKKTVLKEPKEGRWEDPTRDATMKRVFFGSLGMHLIEKVKGVEAGYVCDTTDLNKYESRDAVKYESYGSITYFDNQGNVIKIMDKDGTMYRPGDKYWEWAKLKSRTGVFVKVALIHLAEAHYIWGNYPGTAMRMFLPPKHPVRRAFTAHFFKTAYTCDRAKYSLFAAKGILSRGLSWKYKGGLEQSFIDLIEGFEFSTWPDELKAKGVNKCKFHVGANDGVELHTVLSDYVSDRLDHVYASQKELDDDVHMKDFWDFIKAKMPGVPEALTLDNLKMFWGEVLFRVTGWHESIGQVTPWALDAGMINLHLRPKEDENLVASQESFIGVGMITSITTVPCPVLGEDWKHVFEDPDNAPYTKLRKGLKQLGKTIEDRNKVRHANVDFHPDICAISISS